VQCNIDQRGARYRLVWGLINLAAAAVLALLALWLHLWWLWIIAPLCLAGGILGIYESRKKWCIMRAMGFKTPL
jgi:uncharacterized membrane protein